MQISSKKRSEIKPCTHREVEFKISGFPEQRWLLFIQMQRGVRGSLPPVTRSVSGVKAIVSCSQASGALPTWTSPPPATCLSLAHKPALGAEDLARRCRRLCCTPRCPHGTTVSPDLPGTR